MNDLRSEYIHAIDKLEALGAELFVSRQDIPVSSKQISSVKFSIELISTLLQKLGDPHRKFPSVLIAGTNGKGSTSATLSSIADAAGLRTGLYTSPHLTRVNERMQLSAKGNAGDGNALGLIDDEAFARIFGTVERAAEALVADGALPHGPSFFEMLTAMAFVYFAEQRVDLAVLEVGLGGRLDATNVVEPMVSVITDIAMDHMEYLGETLQEIAREKAGILRRDGVLVTLSQHPQANQAIGDAALALNVRGVDASRCLPPRGFRGPAQDDALIGRNRYSLAIDGAELEVDSPLAGQHQQRNLALAIATAIELRSNHGFAAMTNEAIARGIRQTQWPGRLETILTAGHAPLLLDVAHNPAGAWALRAALAELDEARPRTLIFSCLRDKQVGEMAQVLFPLFDAASGDPARGRDHIVLAPIQNPRAASVEELLAAAHALDVPAHAAPHLPAALAQARAVTPADGIIIATGSVYLVGEIRELALDEAATVAR